MKPGVRLLAFLIGTISALLPAIVSAEALRTGATAISKSTAPGPSTALYVTARSVTGPSQGLAQDLWVVGPPRRHTKGDSTTDGLQAKGSVAEPMEMAGVDPAGGEGPQTQQPPILVQILANEMTYGPNGAPRPTSLSYELGGQSPVLLANGAPIAAGQVFEIPSPEETTELRLIGQSIGYDVVASDDDNLAIVLTDGDDLFSIAAQKQVQIAVGGQATLEVILASYLNPSTGIISLPPNQAIVLHELCSSGPACTTSLHDFQDLVTLITVPGTADTTVTVIDRIGSSTVETDGNQGLSNFINVLGGAHYVTPVEIIPSQDLTLAQLRMIGYVPGSVLDFEARDYRVMIWSSIAAAKAAPSAPDLYNFQLDATAIPPAVFGQGPPQALGGVTYELTFDLTSFGIPLSANQDYAIGISTLTIPGSFGTFSTSMVDQTGDSDIWIYSSTSWILANQYYTNTSGRVAVRIDGIVADGGSSPVPIPAAPR